MKPQDNIPTKFIDSLGTRKHMVLFYDEPEDAQKIEFRFIKNGLSKGEHCVYATDEDPKLVIDKMTNYGIAVDDFKKKNLLHVYQLNNPFDHPDGPKKGGEENLKMILADSKPPFRIVSGLIPNRTTTEGVRAQMELEQDFHSSFDKYDCSVICPYNIEKMEPSKRKDWFDMLFSNHHTAIFVPKYGESGVFDLT